MGMPDTHLDDSQDYSPEPSGAGGFASSAGLAVPMPQQLQLMGAPPLPGGGPHSQLPGDMMSSRGAKRKLVCQVREPLRGTNVRAVLCYRTDCGA